MYTDRRFWFPFALGALATVLALVLWTQLSSPPPAYGQIPDSGAQRAQMVQEQKITNQKLTEIATILTQIRDRQAGATPEKEEKPAPTPREPSPKR